MRIPTPATTDLLCLKIREIAARSPMDLAALDVLADMVIDQLDQKQRPRRLIQRVPPSTQSERAR